MSKKMPLSPARVVLAAAALMAAGVTLFAAAATQQVYRQSANDPQTQLVQEAWVKLTRGIAPAAAIPTNQVDLSAGLSPFVMVFDANDKLVATNAINTSGGRVPLPPSGVFNYAHSHGRHQFTWQTANGDRYAAVLSYVSDAHPGYVLAARSLYEVEQREDRLRLMAFITLIGIGVVGATAWFALK